MVETMMVVLAAEVMMPLVLAEVAEVTQEDMAEEITLEVVVHSIVIHKVQIP
jgi:hypothetical protein